jgi:hypothetical protein
VTVSPLTERKLREAMSRLLAGTAQHTDGALTKENLAREAGVSHATVHRAADVLAEWDAKVARPVLRSAAEVRRDETITTLSARLRDATQRITQLQGKPDALASVTADLYHENQQLRRQLGGRHAAMVVPLPAAD